MNFLEEYSDNEEIDLNDLIITNCLAKNILNINLNESENIIDKEYESIYTLSKISDIQNNKKIQFIKQMLNYVLKNNFTNIESLIIHSIYNHNKECLEKRNKTFKEYALVLIILKKFNIKLTQNMITFYFPKIPYNENSKKIKKIINEINSSYKFDTFLKQFNNNTNILPEKKIPKTIKMYVNGFIFYIKNIFIIKDNYNKILLNKKKEYDISEIDVKIFNNLLLSDKNSTFCNDKNLNLIGDWISNIFKNILIFNTYIYQKKIYYSIPINKSLEYQVQILINLFIYIILLLHSKQTLVKEKFKYSNIINFLTINYKDTIIPDIITNKVFYYILLYIYTKKTKSIFSSKKFFRVLYNYLK